MTRVTVLALLLAALAVAVVLGAYWGTVSYSPATILGAVVHPHTQDDAAIVLWSLRFPRIAIGALVGAALAFGGTLLQDLLGNPIVDPYLTGASAGAALAIAVAIAVGAPPAAYSALALGASLATTLAVALLARTGSGLSVERMIVAGVALSSLFVGLTTLVILLTPSGPVSLNILAWLGGSIAGHGWSDLGWASLYAAIGALLALAAVPALNAMRLGARRAQALGVDIDRTRWIVIVAICLLTSAAVSVSGIIGFVGMIVPHIARALVGHDVRWSIGAAIPIGALVVILADAIARTAVPPTELPLGILLSILGVPAFLYLMMTRPKAI